MRKYNVAVVGATGAVGQEILKVLTERNFPIQDIKMLASERSHGKKIPFQGKEYMVEATEPDSFEGIDVVLFAGGSASKQFAHEAVKRGAVVIDNSSAFRMDPEVPLVVPEVNPEDVRWHKGIIANPNCSTIQMVVALKPLHDAAKITRVIVSTYQAVSGAGKEAIDELDDQVHQFVSGHDVKHQVFPYQIAFNLIPHIDVFLENDYTKEEMKMVQETQKMFHDDSIAISATTVRVPVFRSHSEAVNVETEKPLSPAEAKEIFRKSPGVVVVDDPVNKQYPMPLFASDTDDVYVGRIRKDISTSNGLVFWVVADQLRKGAATNAVQIAELLVKENLLGN